MIEEKLKIPVIEDFKPICPPCVTYYPISDNPVLCGDGETLEETESYQIDIWCKKRSEACNMAKIMKKAIQDTVGNTIPTVSYYYDNNGKTWRGNLIFEHIREE